MMMTVEIRDFTSYEAGRARNGGAYAFYETIHIDGAVVTGGKHSTSAEFDYCPYCGSFESKLAEHVERFHDDEKYEPSAMAVQVAEKVAAGQSAEQIQDWLNKDGHDFVVVITGRD